MKKIIAIGILVCIVIGLSGCTDDEAPSYTKTGKLTNVVYVESTWGRIEQLSVSFEDATILSFFVGSGYNLQQYYTLMQSAIGKNITITYKVDDDTYSIITSCSTGG